MVQEVVLVQEMLLLVFEIAVPIEMNWSQMMRPGDWTRDHSERRPRRCRNSLVQPALGA